MRKFLSIDNKLEIHRLQTKYSLGDLGTIRNVFSQEGLHVRALELPKLPPQMQFIPRKNQQGYIVRIPYELSTKLFTFCHAIASHIRKKGSPSYTAENTEYQNYINHRKRPIMLGN